MLLECTFGVFLWITYGQLCGYHKHHRQCTLKLR